MGVSILWRHQRLHHPPRKSKGNVHGDEIYIDEVEPHHLSNKRLVGIDPNKGDLIYCSGFKFKKGDASDGGQMTSFRYTQNQRRYESKKKVTAKRLENEKARTEISEGCNVHALEHELSQQNRKTLSLDIFLTYLQLKYITYLHLYDFYCEKRYRKRKWHIYINTQRSESKLLNHFQEKFGPPQKVVIGFGDWDQGGSRQMRYHEPAKGIGMRKLFRRAGYPVYLS